MAYINADNGKIWDYYMILANAGTAADSECEEMLKNLNKLGQQIDQDIEGSKADISGLKQKIEEEEKKETPDYNKISQLKMQTDEADRHIKAMEKNKMEALFYVEKVKSGQKEYAAALGAGKRYVSNFLLILDSIVRPSRGGESAESSAGMSGINTRSGISAMEFRGHVFYGSDDAIELNRKDGNGRSNLERMEAGDPPLGNDGLSMNLHHMEQSDAGNFMELSQTKHKQFDKQLHINKGSGIPSGVNRKAFEVLKKAYWKKRASVLKQRSYKK